MTSKVEVSCLSTHKVSKLVVDNLNHHLSRLNGSKHVLSKSLLLNSVRE